MRRFSASFICCFTVLCLTLTTALPAQANSRRAVLVMDVDSGKILRQENGHAKRYPASLTKMMTLYLLFDALRKGEVKLSSRFTASKYASQQPQTNISLRPGDKIAVEDAIRALVVRSANDVAVVVAEGLGRSEWNFGVMMTEKARELGMKNTVFRNPHGLPNSRQYTSAYDMAVLGAALRRDFPQYYDYFTTKVFRFKGRTYTSHNRVIGRFDGVDGIKTGFINASGFNLVSSVKRNGYFVVAVIMGGVSGGARDNEMVSILNSTFASLDAQKDRPRQVATAPDAALNPRRAAIELAAAQAQAQGQQVAAVQQPSVFAANVTEPQAEQAPAPRLSFRFGSTTRQGVSGARRATAVEQSSEAVEVAAQSESEAAPAPVEAPLPILSASVRFDTPPAVTPPATSQAPVQSLASSAKKTLPAKGTLEYQMAMLQEGQGDIAYDEPRDTLSSGQKNWGIQVGAFRQESQARDAVRKAFGIIQGEVGDAYITISRDGDAAEPIHRARLGNLSRAQADTACRKLNAMNQSCFPVQME